MGDGDVELNPGPWADGSDLNWDLAEEEEEPAGPDGSWDSDGHVSPCGWEDGVEDPVLSPILGLESSGCAWGVRDLAMRLGFSRREAMQFEAMVACLEDRESLQLSQNAGILGVSSTDAPEKA